MLVVVQYQDETYDMVIKHRLDELLQSGTLLGFSSASGWVEVDRSSPEHGDPRAEFENFFPPRIAC